ncbi:MAG TPA: molybdate ABC transporter substrate-binding protein [Vicinamibacterales bacterium]|nr:molybdate ABC transporter substrate-binding protein [Vicinamibacterales bacterium]
MLILLLLVLLTFGPPPVPESQEPVTVSAALSLTDVLEDIAEAYAKSGAGTVRLNLAASNVLARQIRNGAPVDVFISADEAQMDMVERAGSLLAGSRVDLLGNRLAVAAAPGRLDVVRHGFHRADPAIRRLAIGDPAAVPAGVYARQFLEARGLWAAYQSRLVPTASVRAALTAVDQGSVDAAIVYATDLRVARRAREVFVVPADEGPRIVYPAAILKSARQTAEAASFFAFLQGPEAAAIFARHGFSTPSSQLPQHPRP